MHQISSSRGVTRRSFLKTAAVSALVPSIIRASPLRAFAPSDTMRLGCIGVGRQGLADMQELIYRGLESGARVVAVCDVDRHRLEKAQWLVDRIYSLERNGGGGSGCAGTGDFRELLGRKDIDGVLVVTPDHWHAVIAVAAAEAGKDIYVEKPLTYSITEGRALVQAVRRRSRILQVGSQQRSSVGFRTACELVRNGVIGRVKSILIRLPQDSGAGDARPMPVPINLNYDFWLGPAREAPFTEDRVHPQMSYERPGWMQVSAYDHGMITNWGAHMVDIAQWGNGTEDTGPVEIEGKGEFPDRGLFDVHTTFHVEAKYANGIPLVIETGDPPGVRFEGGAGWIHVTRDKIEASDRAILRQKTGDGGVKLPVSTNHMKNFLESMRSRRDPVAPVEAGHRSNTICVMAHIAMKLGRRLRWDPAAERFIGDDEANGWLDYPHRRPWTI